MKYFIDLEFHEDGRIIDLISIAIVAEDGRELYMVSADFDEAYARTNQWLVNNVLPHVAGKTRCTRGYMRKRILDFCNPDQYGKPEFWGYFCDYDWVALCQLFGKMIDLPEGWPMYCRDLKQLADEKGEHRRPRQAKEHDALADAGWNKRLYYFLTQSVPPPDPEMRAACLAAYDRADFLTSEELLSWAGPYTVSIHAACGKHIWTGGYRGFPTFERVRRHLASQPGRVAIPAWRIFRHFRESWRPMNPAASEALFGNDYGTVVITRR